jgi:hypothetical protein
VAQLCKLRSLNRKLQTCATSSSIAISFAFVRILCAHSERDSTACGELRGHDCLAGRACFHEVVQNSVRDRFVEGALVPIGSKIKLERFAFDAQTIRHVIDVDPGKIGLTRDWANRSEIVRFEMNSVIPARRGIWESFEPRLGR